MEFSASIKMHLSPEWDFSPQIGESNGPEHSKIKLILWLYISVCVRAALQHVVPETCCGAGRCAAGSFSCSTGQLLLLHSRGTGPGSTLGFPPNRTLLLPAAGLGCVYLHCQAGTWLLSPYLPHPLCPLGAPCHAVMAAKQRLVFLSPFPWHTAFFPSALCVSAAPMLATWLLHVKGCVCMNFFL